FRVRGDQNRVTFAVPALVPPADVSAQRLTARRALLERFDAARPVLGASAAGREMLPYYERAFDLLTSGQAQAAFDLEAEPGRVRDRYGRNLVGQSVLLARRLVEAGLRFVNVPWPNVGGGRNWGTHSHGFNRLHDSP